MIEPYQLYRRSYCIKTPLTIQREDTIYFATNQGKLLEKCFIQGRNIYKKTVKESGLSRQWAHFLQRLVKLIEDYNQLLYCTINLKFIIRDFKIIQEYVNTIQTNGNNTWTLMMPATIITIG